MDPSTCYSESGVLRTVGFCVVYFYTDLMCLSLGHFNYLTSDLKCTKNLYNMSFFSAKCLLVTLKWKIFYFTLILHNLFSFYFSVIC